MAQRGSTSKPTRFKGPTVVTLRGAGASGNDPLLKGAGGDIGLDIQIPVAQTANAFQITKPDGTVIYASGPNGTPAPPIAITASGAVPVRPGANYVITNAGITALTLAAPTAGADDGVSITIESATAFAHTLTATGLLSTGSASVNVATFAAFAGASVTLRAYNGKWVTTAQIAITFS
jgi:hypothetical protein